MYITLVPSDQVVPLKSITFYYFYTNFRIKQQLFLFKILIKCIFYIFTVCFISFKL